ncbi:ankyrin repeat domain-containing protein [Candidatus Dependentiae bacterium]|nr:ankyrin repeat domain-containing protein [Candidatus Dependentiae bacterium]
MNNSVKGSSLFFIFVLLAQTTTTLPMALQTESRALELVFNDEPDILGLCLKETPLLTAYKYPEYEGKTLLHLAVDRKKIKMVQFLLQYGFDINAQDNEGKTPLHIAAFNDSPLLITYLLKLGANSLIKDKEDFTAYEYAVKHCQEATLNLIKAHEDILRARLKQEQDTAQQQHALQEARNQEIFVAVTQGKTKQALDLINLPGQDINIVDKDKYTPLHYAVMLKHYAIVGILLNHHALVDAENKYGVTPLMLAAQKGDEDALALLIDYGASSTEQAFLASILYNPITTQEKENAPKAIQLLADTLSKKQLLAQAFDNILNRENVEKLGEEKVVEGLERAQIALGNTYGESLTYQLNQACRTLRNAQLEKECPICFEVMKAGRAPVQLVCNHIVCNDCKKELHICPLCRQQL